MIPTEGPYRILKSVWCSELTQFKALPRDVLFLKKVFFKIYIALSRQFNGWYLKTNHTHFLRKFNTVLPVQLKTVLEWKH